MTYLSKKIVQGVAVFFVILALLLLMQIDSVVLQCTEAFFPGFGAWVCLLLIALEVFAGLWLYKALFCRPSRLVLKADATEEERALFANEMEKRLAKNPHVLAAGLSPLDADFTAKAMAHLDSLADQEIRANGKKVFLGTALSQNGRLDALIVFFSLCRTVWRISAIYNQRPTPEELWSVCSTVSSSTFVAFSIEALDLPQTITESMNELVPSVAPAMAASSVPFLGAALHVFTKSLIDGAANCLLAVRAGIITRRAYSYAMQGGTESLRRSCVRETASMMVDISQEVVGSVVNAFRKELQDLSIDGGKKLVSQAGTMTKNLGVNAVTAVKDGAVLVKEGASQAVQTVGEGAGRALNTVKEGASQAVQTVGEGAGRAFNTVKEGASQAVQTVGEGAGRAFNTVKEGASQAVTTVGDGANRALTAVKDGASSVLDHGKSGVEHAVSAVKNVSSSLSGAGHFVQERGKNLKNLVQHTGQGLLHFFARSKDSKKHEQE